MVFDTHAHVLSADRVSYPFGPLRGGAVPPVNAMVFPVEELVAQMDSCAVAHACLVQRATLYGYDNRYALAAAAAYAGRLAPVIVLDAQDSRAPAALRELAARHPLAGIRVVAPTLSREDTGWLDSAEALGLWDCAAELALPVAVILYMLNNEHGRRALLKVARRFPQLPILLDHCGLPHPSTPEKRWAEANGHDYSIPADADFGIARYLGEFQPLTHVLFKLTDINFDRVLEAGLDIAHFTRAMCDAFGSTRLVWGSDVGQSPAPYAEKTARLRAATARLATAERDAFTGGNAARLYGRALARQ
jgi:L-fuconolactonase